MEAPSARRAPQIENDTNPLLRWWLVAIVAIGIVCGWEAHWRGRGFVPSANDTEALWSLSRTQANVLGKDAVVLIGSSRIQMGIHQGVLSEVTGWESAVQLAGVRGASMPVLQSLAEDPEFRGTVLMEINPLIFFSRTPHIDQIMETHAAFFRNSNFADRLEARLRAWLDLHLISRLPALAPNQLWTAWRLGGIVQPSFGDVMSRDRFRYGDYVKFPNLELFNQINVRLRLEEEPFRYGPAERMKRGKQVQGWIEAIQARGGQVILVRLPSAIHARASEERWFSRHDYWDRLVESTHAPAIHFLDHPELANFAPPDGDHMGEGDARRFTRAFGQLLVHRSLAPPPREAAALD